jgi:putative oxidoreductase
MSNTECPSTALTTSVSASLSPPAIILAALLFRTILNKISATMSVKKILFSGQAIDLGLLILRIGIGIMFIWHGWPKIAAGPEMWEKLGGQMGLLGIHFLPAFWGFMAAFAEFFGGILLILGLFTRPIAFIMAFNMFIAALTHLSNGDGIGGASHAIELGIVFLAIMIMGAGKMGLDRLIFGKKRD